MGLSLGLSDLPVLFARMKRKEKNEKEEEKKKQGRKGEKEEEKKKRVRRKNVKYFTDMQRETIKFL
jgi:hypothetical protein